jgi:aryl-alcohol dehydrogenase-like predicted oxidoreductase
MMRYRLLGKSGLRVSELCLGTMTFGETWGWGASKDASKKIFDAFSAKGGNFIDTANNYTDGTSEEYVGEFIHAERERFVLATKYTLTERKEDPNGGGNSRKNMMQSVNRSLKRLNTDYIDLLYLHMWDFATPVEEVMRGMDDLVRAGKILYVAFSDTPAWVVSYAIALAEKYGWSRPVACQFPFSLLDRAAQREVIPMAKTMDLAMIPWGLLEGGELTGKYNTDNDEPKRSSDASDNAKQAADTLMSMARDIGCTPSQIAINWVRQQRGNFIPILGARTEAQINDNLGVLDFELSTEQIEKLNQLADFQLGFPMSFLTNDHVRGLIFGETFALIDNHRAI